MKSSKTWLIIHWPYLRPIERSAAFWKHAIAHARRLHISFSVLKLPVQHETIETEQAIKFTLISRLQVLRKRKYASRLFCAYNSSLSHHSNHHRQYQCDHHWTELVFFLANYYFTKLPLCKRCEQSSQAWDPRRTVSVIKIV